MLMICSLVDFCLANDFFAMIKKKSMVKGCPGFWCYRVLTRHEASGEFKKTQEGRQNIDPNQLRVLIIKGIADGSCPAARSHFLHATDSLKVAKTICMERRGIY